MEGWGFYQIFIRGPVYNENINPIRCIRICKNDESIRLRTMKKGVNWIKKKRRKFI